MICVENIRLINESEVPIAFIGGFRMGLEDFLNYKRIEKKISNEIIRVLEDKEMIFYEYLDLINDAFFRYGVDLKDETNFEKKLYRISKRAGSKIVYGINNDYVYINKISEEAKRDAIDLHKLYYEVALELKREIFSGNYEKSLVEDCVLNSIKDEVDENRARIIVNHVNEKIRIQRYTTPLSIFINQIWSDKKKIRYIFGVVKNDYYDNGDDVNEIESQD
ncbi:MAG: hypothetical protein GWP09_01585 [Nitrospiraceae bacterium]|nr:hypothetical protein [Nitrospiraceae bacterium]